MRTRRSLFSRNHFGRHVPFSLILMCAVLVAACGDVGQAPRAQMGEAMPVSVQGDMTLPIDPNQSEITWRAAKVTRAHDGGFGSFEGTISMQEGEVTGVHLTIDTHSIWSDTDRLTAHLKNEDFFEVDTYPTAVFEAGQIVPVDSAGATHLVTGNLTMHGQTKGITFPAMITVGAEGVQAAADFIIDRTRWGIVYKGRADDLVEDRVRLILNIRTAPIELADAN